MAKHLAGEMHTQLPRSKAGDRWCFLWETSGDRYSLRKVLERLDPIWKRNGITLKEPPTLTPASGAVAGAEASAP